MATSNIKGSTEIKSKFDNTMFGNGVTISSEVVRTRTDQACASPCGSTCFGRPSCVKTCQGGSGCGSTNKLKIHN